MVKSCSLVMRSTVRILTQVHPPQRNRSTTVALGGGVCVVPSPEVLWAGRGGVLGKPPLRKIIETVLMLSVTVSIESVVVI